MAPAAARPRRALSALLCALALVSSAACGDRSETVYVGVVGPINLANGRSMREAVEMAAAELNASPERLGGRRVELVLMDDSANVDAGLRRASALREDERISAVIGHVNSAVSLRAATIYNAPAGERMGTPLLQISPASSSPELTHAGDWTFRVTPTDLEFAPALAQLAAGRLNRRRAAVLYMNDDYGQGVMTSFARAFREQEGQVVAADPFLPAVLDEPGGVDAYLTRAMGRGADALVIGAQAEPGLKILAAARRLGFTGPILGSDGMTGVKDSSEPAAQGVFVASAFLPDRQGESAQRFVRAYQDRYGELPDHRGAMAYDIMYLLADAIREVGTDRRALRDHVAQVGRNGTGFEGVSGTIRFDENGDVVQKPVMVGVVRGNRLVTQP